MKKRISPILVGEQITSCDQSKGIDSKNFSVFLDDSELVPQEGELVIAGYEDDFPTEVGEYDVLMTPQLLERLAREYPDYEIAISVVRRGIAVYQVVE